jgi:arginine deiminase
MVPDLMEELLFDDILFGDQARDEHRDFRRLLERLGVEVLDARDLLVESLRSEEARRWAVTALLEDVSQPVGERMLAADPDLLASMLVEGVRWSEEGDALERDELFEIPPVPNWCFQRDPQVIVGDAVLFGSMATTARTREVLLARTIFRFHPDFRGSPVLLDPLEANPERPLFLGSHRPVYEGGDVMVLSEDLVVVGYSERTNRSGVRHLVRALARRGRGPRWLVVASLPEKRAYMHLDTVLTRIDRGECLAYTPVVLPGHDDSASVFEFDLAEKEPRPRPCADLLGTLAARGVELEPVPCGGDDPLLQQREQWTDGANALALAPGVIVLYERNAATAEELARRGYEIVDAGEILGGRVAVDLDHPRRTCILVPSHEISRARGGPHCLTHGLVRDPPG